MYISDATVTPGRCTQATVIGGMLSTYADVKRTPEMELVWVPVQYIQDVAAGEPILFTVLRPDTQPLR